MKNLMRNSLRFLHDEEGVVAIEYGLMAVFVALAIAVGAGLLGTGLNKLFADIAACFGSGSGACPIPLPSGLTL